MANVDQFLKVLITFDKDHVPAANLERVVKYTRDPNFNGEYLRTKSAAAAGICEWVRNIVIYDEVCAVAWWFVCLRCVLCFNTTDTFIVVDLSLCAAEA